MIIQPTNIEQSGPGVDLSNLPDGISVTMADTAKDFQYSRNMVTLTVDLADYERVHLSFKAREYGDEPHAPPPNPFGDDVDFDGVAISEDGAAWYEIQDLRHLRSDRFTDYALDLDAAIAACGLSYNSAFKIRFCQFDNGPVAWDGIALSNIRLTGEFPGLLIHLAMDDNADDPIVHDSTGQYDQTFLDPGGDPNTAAHSVPGPLGPSSNGTTALSFDGVDDRINFGPTLLGDIVGANCDFTLAFRYKSADPGAVSKYFLRRAASNSEPYLLKNSIRSNRLYWWVGLGDGYVYLTSETGVLDDQWHHIVCRRRGDTLSLWVDGTVHDTKSDPSYAMNLFPSAWSSSAIGIVYGAGQSDWPFAMADLRAYDRALTEEEIVALSQ